MTFRLNRLIQAVIMTLACSYTLSGWAEGQQGDKKPAQDSAHQQQQASADKKGLLPLEDLRTFTEVMQRIKTAYVEEVDDKTLLEDAIKGMLSGLDPHSAYLKPKDFKELEINTSGQFGGLGMEVGMENGHIKVVSPIDDTPAHKAGIQAGDLIIRLDDAPVKGMTLMQSVEKMRGAPGSPIKLTIVREGTPKPLDITVKRAIIKVQSVKTKTLEEGYGYIRISQFQSDTDKELLEDIKKLKKEQKDGKLKGLVLDLRNNPGGVLQAAVGVADAFLDQGLIVYTKGRFPNSELRFNATATDPSEGVPLTILINGGSASASEIVAGALQDHHRAILLGSTSFGKGSVQTVLPLSVDSERGLKLTTALYYTPNGRSIQAEGIKPDIVLPQVKVTPVEGSSQYKEADLKGHLSNGKGHKAPKDSSKDKGKDKGKKDEPIKPEELLEKDYPLSQALNVLKGMYLKSSVNTAKATKTAAEE
uniref:S41 family peptidase n=1 Tax=Endozoicomonas sp. Mp262 TaxID=2919499 RepID=UPI00351B2E6D